jgi:cytochrome c553
VSKNPTAKEKVIIALVNGKTHADSISIHADISIAYGRQILNDMAERKEIVKICGRAHHSYHISENSESLPPSQNTYKQKGYCDKFDNELREIIRNKYDRRCFICNAHEDTFVKRLSVHHADKNRNQGCEEVEWKLVPLCASCHARSHHEPLMSRISYLLLHEDDIVVADYKQIYVEHEECITNACTITNQSQMHKIQTKDNIIKAIAGGMVHTDSIALYSDTSVAYCRRVCNELASDGEIQKISGRAHHTYLPKGDTDER